MQKNGRLLIFSVRNNSFISLLNLSIVVAELSGCLYTTPIAIDPRLVCMSTHRCSALGKQIFEH